MIHRVLQIRYLQKATLHLRWRILKISAAMPLRSEEWRKSRRRLRFAKKAAL